MIFNKILVIAALLLIMNILQGCQGVHLRYHDYPGDRSAIKIFPYWEGDDDEKHVVGGLQVILYSRENGAEIDSEEIIETTTDAESPLLFEELDPGSYRLRVYLNENIHISEKLDLISGKRLTVKVDVRGVRKNLGISNIFSRVGGAVVSFVGRAFVIIGENAIEMAIDSLTLIGSDDDDDDDDGFWKKIPRKERPRPSKKKRKPVNDKANKRLKGASIRSSRGP